MLLGCRAGGDVLMAVVVGGSDWRVSGVCDMADVVPVGVVACGDGGGGWSGDASEGC